MSPPAIRIATIAKKATTCFDALLAPVPPDEGSQGFTRSGSEGFGDSEWTTFGISAEMWVWCFFFSPLSSDRVKEPFQPLFFLCFNQVSYGMAVISNTLSNTELQLVQKKI
jgi:hypothetical protein